MAFSSEIDIAGVTYTASQRAGSRVQYSGLTLNLHMTHAVLTFSEEHRPPTPSWDENDPIVFREGGTVRFTGRIVDTQTRGGARGWVHAYTAYSMRFFADKLVPVEASDGSPQVVFNRSPTETDYYVPSDSGLDCGTMVRRLLTVPATAARLNALGLVGYTSLLPPTLPASTLADLALLDVVPRQPHMVSGMNLLSGVDHLLQRWMPRFVQHLGADGVLRYLDTTDTATVFVPRTFTLKSRFGGGGDPIVGFPTVRRGTVNCATRWVVRGGPQVEATMLTEVDDTLAHGFTGTNITNWTYYDYITPKGSTDHGTVSSVTSTSATIASADPSFTIATNYLSTHQATIVLIDPVATGLSLYESRTVIANTAMAAGGSATVSWDAGVPITSSTYAKYRLAGTSGGLTDTWRLELPREPSTGNTGLLTWVGSHLVHRSPRPVKWANAERSLEVFTAQATVVGPGGVMIPAAIEVVPSLGGFRFVQPTVSVFGNKERLKRGSPTTVSEGLPVDVQVLALYSRGPLTTAFPSDVAGVPQYSGTAAPFLSATAYLDVSSWEYYGDVADMTRLAEEHQKTTRDVEYDVTISWDVFGGVVPAWDYWNFRYAIDIDVDGGAGAWASPWASIHAIPQTLHVEWNHAGTDTPGTVRLTFQATTKRRAFTGDDLYTHPRFAAPQPAGGFQGFGIPLGYDATAGQRAYAAQQAELMQNRSGGFSFDELGIAMGPLAAGAKNEQLERFRFQQQVKDREEAQTRAKSAGAADTPEGIIARTSDAGGQQAARAQGLEATRQANVERQVQAQSVSTDMGTPEGIIAATAGTAQQGAREQGLAETRRAQAARREDEARSQARQERSLREETTGGTD